MWQNRDVYCINKSTQEYTGAPRHNRQYILAEFKEEHKHTGVIKWLNKETLFIVKFKS